MNIWTPGMGLLAIAFALIPLKTQATSGGDTPHVVYRCKRANGKIVYTDETPQSGCVVLFTFTGTGKQTRIDFGEPGSKAPRSVDRETQSVGTAVSVFRKAAPSVVVVVTYDASGKPRELGSGVELPTGVVATNCHVLKDGPMYFV